MESAFTFLLSNFSDYFLTNQIIIISFFSTIVVFFALSPAYAVDQYALSHFSTKGIITEHFDETLVLWTIINEDEGTFIMTNPQNGGYSVTKVQMQTHHLCNDSPNVICLNGTITNVKNTIFTEVDDIVTLVYDMPNTQTISFLSGKLATNTFEVDLTKFHQRDLSRIIDLKIEQIQEDDLRTKAWVKIQKLLVLVDNPDIQELLEESNAEFESLDEAYSVIDERNEEWISTGKDELTPLMDTILDNKVSQLLNEIVVQDKQVSNELILKEIILTNSFGANVAQTGKPTDYKQWDESWWQLALHNALYTDRGFDESANVEALNLAIRIDNDDGRFLGVIKFVIDITGLT